MTHKNCPEITLKRPNQNGLHFQVIFVPHTMTPFHYSGNCILQKYWTNIYMNIDLTISSTIPIIGNVALILLLFQSQCHYG